MLLDPRTSDLLLKPRQPEYRKDHELIRHYGYDLDQLPRPSSRVKTLSAKLGLALADRLIRWGFRLKKRAILALQLCPQAVPGAPWAANESSCPSKDSL